MPTAAVNATLPCPPESSASDEELAARAQLGCMGSFEELLRRFQAPLLGFLRHAGPVSDAEDVLQETFLRVYSRLHFYRPQWRFATWLFTIARRASINYHRRPRPPADDAATRKAASPYAGPAESAAAADDSRRLWSIARRTLNRDEVTALWLHYVDELPVAEIAAVLERSSVSVKTMMFRARKRLLPLVGELDPRGR